MYQSTLLSFLFLAPLAIATTGGATLKLKRDSCTTPEGSGSCVSTSSCTGFSVAGYCPGGTDVQCCISKECSVGSGSGTCLNTSKSCSGGAFQAGACPGDSSVQCCVKGASSGDSPSGDSGSSSSAPKPSSSDPHPINDASIKLIESLEGFRSDYYYINGDKTIGYGHDCTQRQDCGSINAPLSKAEGEALFRKDLVGYEDCVCKQKGASKLTANQYGALTSFTYNAGCGGLTESFGSNFASGDFSGICDKLPSTRTLSGQLSSRRKREAELCKTETSEKSGC